MIDRIISLKKTMIFSATRMEYLVVCEGERCSADMLNMFENFHKSKEEEVIRRVEENRLYSVTVSDYKQKWSLKAIRSGLLNMYSKPTIIKNLEWLCGEGYIRMVNVENENNSNVIEGREVIFMEKKVQEVIDEIMEDLSKRPMPSEVLELIERKKESRKKVEGVVKNLTGGGCQKFDRGVVKNLTTNRCYTDNLIYKEKNENFENLAFKEVLEVELIKYESIEKKGLKIEEKDVLGLFEDESIVELEEFLSECVWRVWNENFKMKEYFLKKCELVGTGIDIDKLISVYLCAFVGKFRFFERKAYLIQKDIRVFQRFTTYVYDSIMFYNQNLKKDGNSTGDNRRNGVGSGGYKSAEGYQFTKAERDIIKLLDGKY